MAKNPFAIALSLALIAACGEKPAPVPPAPEGDVMLHTVMDMAKEPPVLNSHAGDELCSALQPVYRCFSVIPHGFLLKDLPESATDQKFSCYPRIKSLPDGNFIMFYHGGEFGSRVWCTLSSDFKKWSTPQMLYAPKTVSIDKPDDDVIRYVNPDAVVLPDGEILLVVSYRAAGHYRQGIGGGLSFRRSKDGGNTWGKAYDVPVGSNWEPYLLLLPDGTLHCYFTDAIPMTRNSGTGLIISRDGGKTWSAKTRVCQQYKYDYFTPGLENQQYNGQKIYTDQMPCFRVLNDGKTIAVWLEARLEKPVPEDCANSDTYKSYCMMSLVRNPSLEWEDLTSYEVERTGPADRETNVLRGAAGYISTFPSGEVVLSFNISNRFSLKIGNAAATAWRGERWTDGWMQFFDGKGYWGSTEAFGGNFLAIAMHSTSEEVNGMQLGLLYLNHRLDAQRESILVDGDAAEWISTRAFYLGAKNGNDAVIRAAYDDANLYLAVECRDDGSNPSDLVEVLLKAGEAATFNVKVNAKGLYSSSSPAVTCVARSAKTAEGEPGYVCELSIPLSALGVSAGNTLFCYADMVVSGARIPFTFADLSVPATWQRIQLR